MAHSDNLRALANSIRGELSTVFFDDREEAVMVKAMTILLGKADIHARAEAELTEKAKA